MSNTPVRYDVLESSFSFAWIKQNYYKQIREYWGKITSSIFTCRINPYYIYVEVISYYTVAGT